MPEISGEFILIFLIASVGVFFAILFLQSGLDKVTDWKGNLSWLKGHFEKTFLGSFVPFLLGTLTLTELVGGAHCLVGIFPFVFNQDASILTVGVMLCQVNFILLFFGQRIAKDYTGAAGIVPYFLVGIAALYLLMQV